MRNILHNKLNDKLNNILLNITMFRLIIVYTIYQYINI